jgi:uncharacterized protein YcbX
MPAATITALDVYPVKGCRGIGLARAAVTVRGLVVPAGGHGDGHGPGDREWMIVDGAGRFVTQREHPRLALIETALAGGALRLSSPGLTPLAIPLAPAAGVTREVVVWRSSVPAHDAGAVAADWLSAFLGVAVRLVRFDPAHERRCNPDYAGASGAHTAFADGYPVLVIGEASLADLNARLAARAAPALPMNRFRPNVVLAGLDAYDEDHLDTIAADGVVLKLVKPCTRCQITTTDQDRATRGSEPLATLAGYRNDVTQGGVTFGMNAIVVAGAGGELAAGTSAMCTYRF